MENENIDLNILSSIIDNVGAYIYTKNLEGKYTYANQLVLDLFDTTLDQMIGKDDSYFFDSSVLEELIQNDKKVFAGQIIEIEESLVIKQTKEQKYYIVVKKPLYDENKNIIGMFGISTDITKQKLLEKKISQQKQFLDTVLDNVDAFIYMKDENRVFRYVNSKVAKLFQKEAFEIIGKKDTDVIDEKTADAFWVSDIEVIKNQKKKILEEKFEDENTRTFYISIKIPYELEGVKCALGFSTDITEVKEKDLKLKEQDKILNQQAKISAMGEMIENIAHQWRQPLSIISAVSTGIKACREANIKDEDQLVKGLDSITNSVEYLSGTIEYFRDYLHKNQEKSKFSIRYLIAKTLDLILIDLETNKINLKLDVEDIELFTYQNDIVQILLNIIMNSKDAFKSQNMEDKTINIKAYKKQEDLFIEIYDNAGGIKDENINRVFEPYFTTKHKSQGTGIGLFMCQQIARKHLKASLIVRNEQLNGKKGAFFSLKIPI